LNDAVVAFAATVTELGTVSAERPVLLNVTRAPPDPAAFDKVTVQEELAFAPKVVELHCKEERTAAVTRLMFAVWNMPPNEPVTVPLWSPLNTPVVIVNDAVVAFACTVTDCGTVTEVDVKLVASGIHAPPWGATAVKVTVHVLLAFEPKVVGLHCRADKAAETPTVMEVLSVEPL